MRSRGAPVTDSDVYAGSAQIHFNNIGNYGNKGGDIVEPWEDKIPVGNEEIPYYPDDIEDEEEFDEEECSNGSSEGSSREAEEERAEDESGSDDESIDSELEIWGTEEDVDRWIWGDEWRDGIHPEVEKGRTENSAKGTGSEMTAVKVIQGATQTRKETENLPGMEGTIDDAMLPEQRTQAPNPQPSNDIHEEVDPGGHGPENDTSVEGIPEPPGPNKRTGESLKEGPPETKDDGLRMQEGQREAGTRNGGVETEICEEASWTHDKTDLEETDKRCDLPEDKHHREDAKPLTDRQSGRVRPGSERVDHTEEDPCGLGNEGKGSGNRHNPSVDEKMPRRPEAKPPIESPTEIRTGMSESKHIETRTLNVLLLSPNATLPTRGSEKAAGLDLHSSQNTVVPARTHGIVETDIAIQFPDGMYARIAPRSGLALKHGVHVGAGVIDQDYTGPIRVCLFNHEDHEFEIKKGDRIAHLILEGIYSLPVKEVIALEETSRSSAGFGSTGVSTTVSKSEEDPRKRGEARRETPKKMNNGKFFARREWSPVVGRPEPSNQIRNEEMEGPEVSGDVWNLSMRKYKRLAQNGSDPQTSAPAPIRSAPGKSGTHHYVAASSKAESGANGTPKASGEQGPRDAEEDLSNKYKTPRANKENLTNLIKEPRTQTRETTDNLPQGKHPGQTKPGLVMNLAQKPSPTYEKCSLWSERRMDLEKDRIISTPVDAPPVGDLLRAPLPPPEGRNPGILVAEHLVPLDLHPEHPAEICYFASGVTIAGGTNGPRPYVHQGRAFVRLLNSRSTQDDLPNVTPPPPGERHEEGFVVVAMDTDSTTGQAYQDRLLRGPGMTRTTDVVSSLDPKARPFVPANSTTIRNEWNEPLTLDEALEYLRMLAEVEEALERREGLGTERTNEPMELDEPRTLPRCLCRPCRMGIGRIPISDIVNSNKDKNERGGDASEEGPPPILFYPEDPDQTPRTKAQDVEDRLPELEKVSLEEMNEWDAPKKERKMEEVEMSIRRVQRNLADLGAELDRLQTEVKMDPSEALAEMGLLQVAYDIGKERESGRKPDGEFWQRKIREAVRERFPQSAFHAQVAITREVEDEIMTNDEDLPGISRPKTPIPNAPSPEFDMTEVSPVDWYPDVDVPPYVPNSPAPDETGTPYFPQSPEPDELGEVRLRVSMLEDRVEASSVEWKEKLREIEAQMFADGCLLMELKWKEADLRKAENWRRKEQKKTHRRKAPDPLRLVHRGQRVGRGQERDRWSEEEDRRRGKGGGKSKEGDSRDRWENYRGSGARVTRRSSGQGH